MIISKYYRPRAQRQHQCVIAGRTFLLNAASRCRLYSDLNMYFTYIFLRVYCSFLARTAILLLWCRTLHYKAEELLPAFQLVHNFLLFSLLSGYSPLTRAEKKKRQARIYGHMPFHVFPPSFSRQLVEALVRGKRLFPVTRNHTFHKPTSTFIVPHPWQEKTSPIQTNEN
jgi:hypothetical protein